MFDHVVFGVTDYAASKTFFVRALEPLGVVVVHEGPLGVELCRPDSRSSLCIRLHPEAKPAHLHLAFTADNRQQVDAFHRAALEAGARDNGAPGLRPSYHPHYYAAFVIGPDGHNIEAVCHESIPMNTPPHSTVHVRAFEARDAEAIAAVIVHIQQVEFGIPITLEAQPDLRDIAGFYRHGCGNFWVAEADGRIVGTIALLDIGNREAALRKMFVAAPFRGREYGVAQRLLGELVTWAKRHDVARVYLGTTAKFLAAHRFYEKNGFTEVARSELPRTFPVMAVDTKFYRLALSADAA